MQYTYDSYTLYDGEGRYAASIRVKVTMKEPVDGEILRHAVNTAITRYPYFAVRVELDENGGFLLPHNPAPVAVLPLAKKIRLLGSEEVNGHLLFAEYEGKDIFFNISHSLCGGKGAIPWVLTNVYQYVKERYHIEPDAPAIRKPGEPIPQTEIMEPTMEMLGDEPPIFVSKSKNPAILLSDYLNGVFNPFLRNPNYHVFTFRQDDLVKFMKANDASVISFFLIVTGKAMDRVLPEKIKIIGAETAHNPSADIGLPDSHFNLLTHIFIDYDRDQLKWDMEKLGTMTRGQIILQVDPTVSKAQLRGHFKLLETLDAISGHKQKMDFMKKNNPGSGKDARHGTYIVNYTGRMDWGEVADYVESYAAIVEGHALLEITSMADQIFVSFMQLLKNDKYINAFCAVLDELQIPYKKEGPFPKHLSKHQLP